MGLALALFAAACGLTAAPGAGAPAAASPTSATEAAPAGWAARLDRALCESGGPAAGTGHGGGEIAVYVKDLVSGETYSLRAAKAQYLASGVKLPIALEVLRLAEEGALDLDRRVPFEAADLVPGSTWSCHQRPGTAWTVRDLLEHSLVESDNTAADLLLREVGAESVNACVRRLVPEGFREITSLADVRRHALSGIFPESFRLTNPDLVEIEAAGGDEASMRELARRLGRRPEEACLPSLEAAFDRYYESGLNSATLEAYGGLLEKIARGEALGPESTGYLLDTMTRVKTGAKRIRAGLPATIEWAHKTGTQRARVCDFGLAWRKDAPEHRVVVAAVASGFPSQEEAERALRKVGEALAECGIFDGGGTP